MVYILLANGFEEAEAIVPADLLRRGGAEVALVGVTGQTVTGAHGIALSADCTVEQADCRRMEMLVIPGGLPGVEHIAASDSAMELVKKAARQDCYLAAICAAPSYVLGPAGLLEGRRAVCYPGIEAGMTGALAQTGQSVIADGKIITGEGPGAAFDFGLKLVEVLKGAETARQVAQDACWRHGDPLPPKDSV